MAFTVGYDQKKNIEAVVNKICCNHDTCVFSRRMALCLAYDSSTEHYLHVLLLLPTLQVVKIFISTACGVCQMSLSSREIEERRCTDPHLPPCATYLKIHRFGELMAFVFSRDAWHCVWHMIQIWVPTNPGGAERVAPLRNLSQISISTACGLPNESLLDLNWIVMLNIHISNPEVAF
ncbi:hypothetical protein RHMOL_Rhmol08G0137400 [Rhododendron molle]|uniref:Uncharacterized protein n=1 Tax=Rhododendron molle TaxID=49168 RepID=A0ACC0MPC2_RHOML|nr:hypothetical protein RHMOL_Rhmol08G0137400 [Rhododendron molle]